LFRDKLSNSNVINLAAAEERHVRDVPNFANHTRRVSALDTLGPSENSSADSTQMTRRTQKRDQ
jgi:hypothetical protein